MNKYHLSGIIVISIVTIGAIQVTAGMKKAIGEFVVTHKSVCEKIDLSVCLSGVDSASFEKFSLGAAILGNQPRGFYIDKNAIYYHPLKGDWTRVEMQAKNLKSLGFDYVNDGETYFYNGLPTETYFFNGLPSDADIIPMGKLSDGEMTFYARGFVALGENVYYRGVIEGGLEKSTIEKKNGILFHGDTLLLPDGWKLHRIPNVDVATLKKVFNYYEDKNNKYIINYTHSGFDINIEKK